MRNVNIKISIMAVMMGIMFSVFSTTYAQGTPTQPNNDYTVLAPLPGIGENGATTNLGTYLPAAFNIAIAVAAVLAFLVITYGGVLYATSDALSGKAQGREYIENAIYGLLLVIGAWVILYTINPQILDFNLSLPRPNIPTIPTVVVGGCPDCKTLSSLGIPTQGSAVGKSLSQSSLAKFVLLNERLRGSGITWAVTEGYPPTTTHQDTCHANGTCVDATITNKSASNINSVAQSAASVGLSAFWEVQTQVEMDALIKSGVRPLIVRVIPYATGSHFHIQ
ncbi:MAG: hypothetical protein NTX96_01560 [Candidatus Zambryskibacteria bacterium]|nr:hypothetical protein [Candidatus Zambryskibacteria bacterium]